MSLAGTGGIELRIDSATARDITAFVKRFVWTESMIAGGFSWGIEFATEDWPEFTDLLLGRDTPVLRFRLLSQQDGGVPATTDWRTAITDGSSAGIRGETFTGRAHGADRRLDMRQKARTRAWPQASVSDLVARIGADYGFAVQAADSTAGRRDRWQLRQDDWSFLAQSVREVATSSGRGDAFVWLDEETLHFGAPSVQVASDRRHDMSEIENRVDRFVVGYQGREVDRQGGATLVGVGYDLDKQKAVIFKLDEGQTRTQPALASKVPRSQADGLRVLPVMEEGAALVEEHTRGKWGKVAPRYFSLRVDTRPDLTLRPGMVVEMQTNLDARHRTPFLGRFVVLEVQHILAAGAITTVASCFRRESYEGEEDPIGAAVAQGATRDAYRLGQPDLPRTVLVAEVLD